MSTKSKKSAPSKKSKASSKKNVRWWLPWSKIGWPRRVVRILWMSCAALWLSTVLIVLLYRFVTPPLTPLMVQRFFQQFNDKDRSVHFECEHVSINEISQHLIDAVVYSEDGAFMCHGGFDFKQLRLSYLENKKGRRIRGGSTISQQTAKNAFLPHTRSMLRKAVEAHFTILIETFWSKKRIMEVYLNIIEFGDGIYGCEAAAQHYFGKSAKNLTKREAAQLAVCLPAPLRMNPAKHGPYFERQTGVVMKRLAWGNVNLDKPKSECSKENKETFVDFVLWFLFKRK